MEHTKLQKPNVIVDGKEITIENFYISELGYLMLKTYIAEEKVFKTFNLGMYIKDNNIFKDLIKS